MTPPQPELTELDLRRACRLFGRAARLRCPNCGGSGIFRTLVELRPDCPGCGMELDRGESDYFLGVYLVNLVAVEFLFAAGFALALILTWPTPPWTLIQYASAVLMVVAAVACYPFSKVLWMAFDVMLRPVSDDELPGPLPPALMPDVHHPGPRAH